MPMCVAKLDDYKVPLSCSGKTLFGTRKKLCMVKDKDHKHILSRTKHQIIC